MVWALVVCGWTATLNPVAAEVPRPAVPPVLQDAASHPFGIQQRIPWTTSRIVGSPEPPPPYKAVRAFPGLTFDHPLLMTKVPGTNRLLVAQEGGKIFTFVNDQACAKPDLFIDMDAEYAPLCKVKDNKAIEWVYGLAFHPQFTKNRFVYICFVFEIPYSRFNPVPGTRVSRFRVTETDPPRVDPTTELPIIEWKKDGHNGGGLVFGPDGYLYIGTGDGGGATPPDYLNTGQSIDDLLSSILRIDVDKPEGKRNYAIPRDNPFVNVKNARGEIWAYGLRNPWRFSFDRKNGHLWAGDVGWEAWEMVYKIERGGNYGWSVMEGPQPARIDAPRGPTPILPPTVQHSHSEAASVTGGFVYYGKHLPGLDGAYVYGDYETGKMWALRYANSRVTELKEIADTKIRITSFGEEIKEEIYFLGYEGGIHKLVPAAGEDRSREFPRKLSETGLFASVPRQLPAPGVVPFSINAEMWSDGATAQRWVALPGKEAARFDGQPPPFPTGGVLAKTLSLDLIGGRRPVETQVLQFDGQVWHGYSYAWNEKGTDATLVDAQGAARPFQIVDASAPGRARTQTWRFGSRAECVRCHNNWAQYRLAFTLPQLNRDHDYGGVVDNQLRTLAHIGLVQLPEALAKQALAKDAFASLSRFADPHDRTASIESRARAYLHVNCAHCHRYGGGGTASFQLQHELPTASLGIVDRPPAQGTFGLTDGKIVAAGFPQRSVLLYRMAKLGGGRMPHIASEVVDPKGVRLIQQWIAQSSKSPPEQTNFVQQLCDPALPAEKRSALLQTFLSHPSGSLLLMCALDDNMPAEISKEAIAQGTAHEDSRIRDLFERYLTEEQRPRRLGSQIHPQALLAVPGNADRGRELFANLASLSCRNCHRIGSGGGEAGPALDQIGKKFNRAQILESILEPSKLIEERYITYLVVTKDGVPYTGVLVDRTADGIVLRDGENKSIRLAHTEIEELTRQRQSLMPEGLLSNLTAQQAADLLSYLEACK
jgi:uncharacterized repeat protein (TIGR03806 family)